MASGGSLVERLVRALPDQAERTVSRLRDEEIVLRAAALGFYGLVSSVPFIILTLWATSAVVGDDRVRDVGERLAELAPEKLGVDRALERISQVGASVGVGALLTLLWPASAYGAGLARAFAPRRALKRGERKGLRGRALSLVLLLVLPGLMLTALVAAYVGTAVLPEGGILDVVEWVFVAVFGFAATTGVLVLIYGVFPPQRLSWGQLWRGAATAATGITVLSVVYVAFLRVGANFESRYATSGLAAVVLFAVWLYLANGLVLVGYEFATEARARQRRPRRGAVDL